jgi:hypothetical protein
MNKNKQTHSGKVEPAGSHKSRTYLDREYELWRLFYDDKWKFDECAAFGGSAYVFMKQDNRLRGIVLSANLPTWTSSSPGTPAG